MVTQESRFYNSLYRHYKNQYLLHAGGILDQPHRYMQAMETLDIAYGNIEAEERERRRREGLQ